MQIKKLDRKSKTELEIVPFINSTMYLPLIISKI